MTSALKTISPVDGSIYVERSFADETDIASALTQAVRAAEVWREVSIEERAALCGRAIDAMVAEKDPIAKEITWQMGRPIRYAAGEVNGLEERARHMIAVAPDAIRDTQAEQKNGFTRFIRHQALGVVFVIAPWNYPFLTSVNTIIPALMAGNTVILKHSGQTPLAAERYAEAFAAAGLPTGVFQFLHLDHAATERIIKDAQVNFVAFTGSVPGGEMVEAAAAGRFIGVGLELGGKDPAYVRADADIAYAVENLVDGAFFNSGQSCCGIERIYVDGAVYDDFIDGFTDLAGQYVLGNPTDPETTLGPMVRAGAADFVRAQIGAAVKSGAKALIDPGTFPADAPGTPYMAPQVLINVNHEMAVMTEESFGPVVGIMKVTSDDQAVELMNNSRFGLTASVWTTDDGAALGIGDRIATGTWFQNRCDYLDPALAWTGVKQSGRGCTLSAMGYDSLTRPKSFHLKTKI
ncbi:MAG: aldehyde dehydrogenase family protein [Proteobacteria bacterium]|nr:aldehyde dehydrogenase family protein [Pseudomonadota bacterium]